MEFLRISIENVLFHLSELFTYLNKVILLLGQRGSDNRERTVRLPQHPPRYCMTLEWPITQSLHSIIHGSECLDSQLSISK